jgi:hypothetical protein
MAVWTLLGAIFSAAASFYIAIAHKAEENQLWLKAKAVERCRFEGQDYVPLSARSPPGSCSTAGA